MILHLLSAGVPTGTAIQIGHLTEGLRAAGETSIICSLEHDQHRKNRIEPILGRIDYCRQSARLDPTIVVRCARRIRKYRPRVLHCWGQHHATLMRVAIRLAGNPPTVWSVRSEAERRNYGKSLLGEAIVTNAKHLANSLMGRSVEVIQNGIVDTKAADVVVPLHHELGLEPNARFIAAVGDLTKKKRWKDLVWAFDLLRVIHPNVHLLLLGNGIESRNVQAFASSAACASGVHMLGHRTDVTSILRQSFCFWQASEDEGCSNAMLEAMAAGLPVIASGIAGHRESLCEGKFGTFVPLGDCAEMARRTNVIMAGPSEANERSTEAREYALQHYSVDKMIGKYRSTYDALLARRAVAA